SDFGPSAGTPPIVPHTARRQWYPGFRTCRQPKKEPTSLPVGFSPGQSMKARRNVNIPPLPRSWIAGWCPHRRDRPGAIVLLRSAEGASTSPLLFAFRFFSLGRLGWQRRFGGGFQDRRNASSHQFRRPFFINNKQLSGGTILIGNTITKAPLYHHFQHDLTPPASHQAAL